MKHCFLALTTSIALTCAVALNASAEDFKLGALTVESPWARASVAANGAAYMVISNDGKTADQLVSATSPVAGTVELHTHVMDGDVMRMRPVKAIEVNVGEPAVLKPGGLHVMLIGLKAPLKEGETFPLTLKFASAGAVTVNVKVEGPGAGGPGAAGSHKH